MFVEIGGPLMNHSLPQLGAQDPELENSPIFDELSAEEQTDAQALEYRGACYFNGMAYTPGTRVRSGEEILLCTEEGLWVRQVQRAND
jgi:hypothetical protein